jgi:hypothetical protein
MSIESQKIEPEWAGAPKYWLQETTSSLRPNYPAMIAEAERRGRKTGLEEAKKVVKDSFEDFNITIEHGDSFVSDIINHLNEHLSALDEKMKEV